MHFAKRIFLMVVASALLVSINSYSAIYIIPKPKAMTLGTGTFTVPSTVLVWGDAKSDTAVMWLDELLRQANKKVTVTADRNSAHFKIEFPANVTDTSLYGKEGYSLVVTTGGVTISAPTSAGQFYAIQTLRQMFPPEVELRTPAQVPAGIVLDAVTVTDRPQWPWRSTMVDPARCWIPLDYLYKTADRIALFKFNIFRLHLTDNEGWRLEVPKYPNLMIKGASTQRGGDRPPAGTRWYYTQDEMKAFVKYCADRHITVIPEIEMPGHSDAAIASYPSLGVLGTTELRTGGGMTSDYLKCGSGATAEVDSFVTEALRMCASVFTTSEYIHIGGDEAVTPAADYTVFIRMVEKKVRALGKKMLGWSEIGNSYNGQRIYQDPTTLVEMYYSGKPPGDIIAWCDFLFLDMCNKNGDLNCQTWAAYLSPQSVYSLNLTQGGPTVHGLIAPLWGELLHPFDTYNDRQMWPRLVSAAEVAWVPAGSNTSTAWTDYSNRLGNFGCRFDRMGMKWYTNDGLVSWKRCTANPVRSSVFDNYVPIKDWGDAAHAGRTPASMLNPAVAAGKVFDLRGRLLGVYSKTAINHSQRLRNGVCLIEVPGQNRVKKLEYQP